MTWVSPNHWSAGFRYGTVQFVFSWHDLVQHKIPYWVEVAHYNIPAVRILLTDKNYSKHSILEEYDPAQKRGPWWHDTKSDKHFFNGETCLEFMIEGDIGLQQLRSMNFVNHHHGMCSEHRTNPTACNESGMQHWQASYRFVSRLIGDNLPTGNLKMVKQGASGVEPADGLRLAWNQILVKLRNLDVAYSGSVKSGSDKRHALGMAILRAFAAGAFEEIASLVTLFASRDEVEKVCQELIAKSFGLRRDFLPLKD